ncbi:type VII secretion target [Mycolicibacterium peregrinum]|uniref:type VII secretion target n=1 Tax=Mycolicibacterium peregrinum TaxID=43304 RepID=UPI0012FFC976|nr:type VII secretion target [Mycolicibacterium peregrinum]
MALSVDPDALRTCAQAHDQVAADVRADGQPDPAILAAMEAGYGPAGAALSAAFAQFQLALKASAEQVASGHAGHAADLRDAADQYTATDRRGAESISGTDPGKVWTV